MKKNIIAVFLLAVFSSTTSQGQNSNTCNIRAEESGAPLSGVTVTNLKTKEEFPNINGIFNFTQSGKYLFQKTGYEDTIVLLKLGRDHTVQLKQTPSSLNEILINANHIPISLGESASSTGLISRMDIERSNSVNINESLNRIPGIFMQTGALNTNRITIRGIGSRNLFGTSKIRAYFKDIPLTNGSGETSLEDFELGAISRIEITKGATSSIYGAGLGGVIQLLPRTALFQDTTIENETTIGSFGLFKNLTRVSHGNSKNTFDITYSNTQSDGYRENNDYSRDAITFHSVHKFNQKNELSVLAAFSDLKAFIPSSLNANNFANTPQSAAFTWAQSMGFEDNKRGLIGLSFKHRFNPNVSQNTSVFLSFRDSYEPRPFNILDEEVLGYGFRHSVSGKFNITNKKVRWTTGIELFRDNYKHQTFENLYRDFPEGTGSVKGEGLSDFKERRQYYNVFFEGRYEVAKDMEVIVGGNLNKTSYRLEDNFETNTTNPDQSGSFKFKPLISPKIGLLQKLGKSTLFANISHGFSPLSLEETLLPDGQINPNLKPETGWNFEIGSRGSLFNKRLSYSVSVYRLAVKNLLVSRRIDNDVFVGINAGRTHHDGLEATLNANLIKSKLVQLSSWVSGSLHHYRFKEFLDDDTNFSGNKLTGVPSSVLNFGADINTTAGWYGTINYQYVGPMPITDANTLFSDSYGVTNTRVGFKTRFPSKIGIHVFVGINNIFDKVYASQILINAASFGGNAPRYFYPGNPINYYSGVSISYSF